MKLLFLRNSFLFLSLFSFASIFAVESQIINIEDVSSSLVKEFFEGKKENVVIEFPKGTKIPVRFFLKGNFLQFIETTESPGYLEVEQKCYAKKMQEELLFSTDLEEWRAFGDLTTGEIVIDFNADDNQKTIILGSFLNTKENI